MKYVVARRRVIESIEFFEVDAETPGQAISKMPTMRIHRKTIKDANGNIVSVTEKGHATKSWMDTVVKRNLTSDD